MVCVIYVCLHAYILLLLPAIDSNENECTEEGEVFEYQGEDQGQADQGKPSKLVAYLISDLLIACFITVYENALFYIVVALNSNCWRLGSASQMISSSWMTPTLTPTYFPKISGVMVSIIAFGKLCGGAKTLGWEHSNGTLKKKLISKTLE
jgi:hypothetical protein